METDRSIMRDLAITHIEGEGDFLLCDADNCCVGDDEDE